MIKYKFDNLNGGLVIEPTSVQWIFAGFGKDGKLVIDVELKTERVNFVVQLTTTGEAKDRSNEAIDALMYELLKPYEVN